MVQGERVAGGGYFSSVYKFLRQSHVRLLMGLWGRVFVGVCGVSLALSCITGLWIYRGWMRKVFILRISGGWRNSPPWAELHKLIGVWSLLFNILIGITGAMPGTENLVNQIEGKWVRPSLQGPSPSVSKEGTVTRSTSSTVTLPVATLLAKAKESFPDFTPRVITFPARAGVVLIRGEVPSLLVAQSHVRTANSITLESATVRRCGWSTHARTQDGRGYIGCSIRCILAISGGCRQKSFGLFSV